MFSKNSTRKCEIDSVCRVNKIIFLIILLHFYVMGMGQVIRNSFAAPYTAMGAYSMNHVDAFGFIANQAALAQISHTAAGVFGERRFMQKELNNYIAVAALPTRSGNFGIRACYSGFNEYNETQLGIAYGRKLGNRVDVGVQFNYNSFKISGYGSDAAVSFEVGTILHLTEKIHTGFHINNPVGGKFGKDGQEKLASVYTMGLGYEASDKFFFSAEIVKEEDQEVNVVAGVQYRFIPQLFVRLGISTATPTARMGFGLSLKTFRLDITSSYHPQLGISPGLLLLFHLKRKAGINNSE